MDPIHQINAYKDTTLALLLAASEVGWNLRYMTLADLYFEKNRAMGCQRKLKVFDSRERWFELGDEVIEPLGELDALLMRKDPPFDNRFLHSTFILEAAQQQGCLVVNDPKSLRDCNEKLFATQFPECCPPLIVSSSARQLRRFQEEHGEVIFKPLDGMGGAGIFRCRTQDKNLTVILETLTKEGREYIMAQKFIPEIRDGDKRILIVNGKVIPYSLARIPAKGETRGNLAAGGTGRTQPLSERDHWIASRVVDTLLDKNLLFVGLDVIGGYLTEINVTSPTCAREIDAAHDTCIGQRLIAAIEQRLAQ